MKQRVLTAALLIPPVLLAVFLCNPLPIFALAAISLLIGYYELSKIAGSRVVVPIAGLVVACGMVPQFIFHFLTDDGREMGYFSELGRQAFPVAFVLLSLIGSMGCYFVIRGSRGALLGELSSLWLIAGLAGLVQIKLLDATPSSVWNFKSAVLLALIPLWIGDTLAIFAGRAFGKHLLAPKISPKKTVEGAVANLLGCIGGAIGLATLIHQQLIVGVLVGLATGILGQAGDLLESAMKRSAGVKDSGALLPGHGGLLDRIDSILLSAPVVALIVVMLGTR